MERLAVATFTVLALLAASCAPGTPPSAPGSPPPPPAARAPASNAPAQSGKADPRQVEERIRGLVAKVLGVEPGEVDVGAPLLKQKVPADELDTVEIVLEVEEAFGVEIPDEEISRPDGELRADLSVKTLAEIVARRKAGR